MKRIPLRSRRGLSFFGELKARFFSTFLRIFRLQEEIFPPKIYSRENNN